MALNTGTRVGVYEVIGQIGSGGMGEVYRATDTRLKRQVALKILPAPLAADAARVARLQREAEVLASLNHPHIAAIYGLEQSEGYTALVMELVEGEDLSEIIARHGRSAPAAARGGGAPRAMNIDDALPIARQIAEALEAAHEQGIIHRDLKPANVRLRADGAVKVLDFGLAKAIGGDSATAPSALENSPTITSPAFTEIGVILGTASYMAPEQARGKPVDRRADIWAFGCVMFEMLSGRRPFAGDSVTDVLSAVISRDPDWTALPARTPAAIRALLVRFVQKDPRKRLRDIGEARVLLEDPRVAVESPAIASVGAQRFPRWLLPAVTTIAALLALATAALWLTRPRTNIADTARVVTRYDVLPPNRSALTIVFRPAVAVSTNGDVMAFAAVSEGVNRIYVRRRSDVEPHAISGSDDGTNPALSPDGKWVAFFAAGSVKKAPVDGQAATIAPARDVRGITWADEGSLIVTTDSSGPLTRMTAEGGDARSITTLAAGERTHRWPSVLPGGKAVLFTVGRRASPDSYDDSNIDAVIVATGERRVVLKGAAMARYCGDGHLIYSKGPALFSVEFDPDRLTTTGSPEQVVPAISRDASTGAAHFDCARDGTLTFVPATSGELHLLVWADKQGHMEPAGLAPGPYQEARVSPDGSRAVLLNGTSGRGDVWVYEFTNGKYGRLTFNGTNAAPLWSPDGRAVYYTSFDETGTRSTVMRKVADGSREAETLATTAGRAYLEWIDARERSVVLDTVDATTDRGDIMRLAIGSSVEPEHLVASAVNEYGAMVSPGGQWLAYEADDTGRPEVYVRDLTRPGAAWQVTVAGGEEPHWAHDGRQLFYRSANRLMAVPIEPGETFRNGNPVALFDGIYNTGIESGRSYDVDPATGRFLLVRPADAAAAPPVLRVVLNWDLTSPTHPRRPSP